MFLKNIKRLKIILIFSLVSFSLSSQVNIQNIQKKPVEQITESELEEIIKELEKNKKTIKDLEPVFLSNGMSKPEFSSLENRINSFQKIKPKEIKDSTNQVSKNTTFEIKKPEQKKSEIFGSEIFTSDNLTFDPNLSSPPPANYILSVGDELKVNLWGTQIFNHTSKISADGTIDIPLVGEIYLNGIKLETARNIIKQKLSKIYSTLSKGQSSLSVTLSKYRSINITIIGSKKPGNYNLSSLSTVFNALYACGGPSENGSYRKIELIRDNKVFKTIDLYDFLIHGKQDDNINLKDNDLIKIPVYTNRVTIRGEVKREGIFELKPNETFSDLLSFCSGFRDEAYKSSIKLLSYTDKERKILNLNKSEFDKYIPNSGDEFTIGKISDKLYNRVVISGAVFRPDEYELTENLKISELIKLADGLKNDAFLEQAKLTRKKEDNSLQIILINLKNIINGDINSDFDLNEDDSLQIYSIFDLQEAFTVSIEGEVLNPKTVNFVPGLNLYDLVLQAGGLSNAASNLLEVSRLIKSNDFDAKNTQISEVINLDISSNFEEIAKNFKLKEFDKVNVRRKPVFEIQKNVSILGSVVYPGSYVLSNTNESILDLINRSGGLKPEADIYSIRILRKETLSNEEYKLVNIPINYSKISKHPKSIENIKLLPEDQVLIAKMSSVVKIIGEVNLDTEIPFKKGKNLRYYINAAGGFKEKKSKKNIYIVKANGYAARTRNYIFFKDYPKITAGSTIYVPTKIEKDNKKTFGEIVALSSVLGSFSAVVISIINNSK
jgi:protein involved in polysaccharide export with SLBB domain